MALAALAGGALVSTHSAEGKFSVSLTVEPARPVVGQPVELLVRTGVGLPRSHRMWLTAVGPWRDAYGQTFLDRRLSRVGPRAFAVTVRPRRWSSRLEEHEESLRPVAAALSEQDV